MIFQVVLWGLLYALPILVRSDFVLTIFIFTFTYGILAVTYDLIFGFTGQLSMFHPAVFGLSAYMTHLLVTRYAMPFWVAMLPSAGTAAALAAVVGSVCFKFRLKMFYFAVVTLAFAEMLRLVASNWNGVTNGTLGLLVLGKPSLYLPGKGIVPVQGPVAWYYVTLVFLTLVVLICGRVVRSWIGQCFRAIRLREDLATALGVDVFRYKLLAFVLGSGLGSFAGALYAYYTGYIDPGYLSIDQSLAILAMVLLGGQGTLVGPIVGSLVLTGLPHLINLPGEIRAILYGAILIVMILMMPQGIAGTLAGWRRRVA